MLLNFIAKNLITFYFKILCSLLVWIVLFDGKNAMAEVQSAGQNMIAKPPQVNQTIIGEGRPMAMDNAGVIIARKKVDSNLLDEANGLLPISSVFPNVVNASEPATTPAVSATIQNDADLAVADKKPSYTIEYGAKYEPPLITEGGASLNSNDWQDLEAVNRVISAKNAKDVARDSELQTSSEKDSKGTASVDKTKDSNLKPDSISVKETKPQQHVQNPHPDHRGSILLGGGMHNAASVPILKVLSSVKNLKFKGKKDANNEAPKEIIRTVKVLTDKQKKAVSQNLPYPLQRMDRKPIMQVLPPNIAQRVYHITNTHLPPVVFQKELDSHAFLVLKEMRNFDYFRAMIGKLSSINVKTTDGNNLLHYSAAYRNYEAALLLMHKGINVNASNNFGVTPLHIACYLNDAVLVSMLVDLGADPNALDDNDMTPLMYAVSHGTPLIIKKLVEDGGADVNFYNDAGLTALDVARYYGKNAVEQYFAKKGLVSASTNNLSTMIVPDDVAQYDSR